MTEHKSPIRLFSRLICSPPPGRKGGTTAWTSVCPLRLPPLQPANVTPVGCSLPTPNHIGLDCWEQNSNAQPRPTDEQPS